MQCYLCKHQDRAGPPAGERRSSFCIKIDGCALKHITSQPTSPFPKQKPGVGEVVGFRNKTLRASKCQNSHSWLRNLIRVS